LEVAGAVVVATGAGVVVVGALNVSGLPYWSIGGVVMDPSGPPRNWLIMAAAASAWTTSTSPA
jgi:hypothetical protein